MSRFAEPMARLIEELKKLIPKAPNTRKAEMIFRLAELYWEKSKYRFGLEMTAFDKAYTEWTDAGRPGKEPTQKDYIRESELIKQNALKLYDKVLKEYPTYERNDEVLFYLGYNEYEAGDKKADCCAGQDRVAHGVAHQAQAPEC